VLTFYFIKNTHPNLPEDSEFNEFSPLIFGFAASGIFLLGLILFAQPKVPVHSWLWLLSLPIFLVGFFLQIFTKRLLFIRIFQIIVSLILTITFTILLWFVLHKDGNMIVNLLLGFTIVIAIAGGVITFFLTSLRQEKLLASNPQGMYGSFNARQGIVILQSTSPTKDGGSDTKTGNPSQAFLARISPLLAGLAMFIVQISSQSGITAITAIVALGFAILTTVGVVRFVRHSLAIIAWEKRHNRRIYLQFR
jgi:hypothetical protein